ncbi:48f4feb3-0ee6-4b11-8ecf-7fd5cbbdd74f-CDS [Sclerotinia trifoliorum]|uniref:48f4feb3-0ee6-4b11-8ecf-7fd5cbbdd74f-CDS n=1 Tax=Sclerotinia trifoliorum TaxID=28548 RepID=A0A8H2ZTQ9_9HELO|nr:48f4feb3-0ee6-4b11-8ecf-7fd5cbbdd74f-CDS [Sclerotinia trifoliorum]
MKAEGSHNPSPLSSFFSDSEVVDLKLNDHQILSAEVLQSLKEACLKLEKRIVEEEEDRMWKIMEAGKAVYRENQWRGSSPSG